MIPKEALDLECLSGLLDQAVIDWTLRGESLYVTGLAVPAWVEFEADALRVVLRTYWLVRPEAADLAALRLANRCNGGLVLVQFWFDENLRRLFGQVTLPCPDGLDRRQFIRTLRQFAEIFSIAVKEHDEDDVLCEQLSDPSSHAVTG